MGDGHLGKCKTCTKNDSRKAWAEKSQIEDWREAEKQRHRDKYHRLEYKEKHRPTPEKKREVMKKYRSKYPEKTAAKNKTASKNGFHAHHWSYKVEHQKDVIYMKSDEHYTLHRFLTYLPEQMIYQTRKGEVLDTKEKHEAFIQRLFENF